MRRGPTGHDMRRRMPRILHLARRSAFGRRRSCAVEHSLGKGEVVSSILTGSTIFIGFPQRHLALNFATACGTMQERAVHWTRIGHAECYFVLAAEARRCAMPNKRFQLTQENGALTRVRRKNLKAHPMSPMEAAKF
jgi:hypothetical protein